MTRPRSGRRIRPRLVGRRAQGLGRDAVWVAVAAALAAGCASSGADPSAQASGVQMSGRMDSVASVAVNDGRPELVEGDCEAATGVPADVCFVARGISGTRYVIGLGNVEGLARDEPVDVATRACATAESCAEVDAKAVALLSVDGRLHRPSGGTAVIRRAEPGARYRGRLRLAVDGGSVSINFDVVPAPAPPEAGPPQPEPARPQRGEAFTPGEVEAYDPQQGQSPGS